MPDSQGCKSKLACHIYDHLELACLFHYHVEIHTRDSLQVIGQAFDVKSQENKTEVLVLKQQGQTLCIPLLNIKCLKVLTENASFQCLSFEGT